MFYRELILLAPPFPQNWSYITLYLPVPPSQWLLTSIPKVAVVVTFSCILQESNCMRLLLHANHVSRDGARVIIWSPDIDAP